MRSKTIFLGSNEASGKKKAVEHQPAIHQRNSIIVVAHLILPEGSEFKDFTMSTFAEFFVKVLLNTNLIDIILSMVNSNIIF